MFIIWLLTLLIYGGICGFGTIHLLFWLLLIPMVVTDYWDVSIRRFLPSR